MNVLHVASEVAPFSKTGGLGDVLWALPRALAQQGAERVTVLSARYGSVDPQRHGLARRLRKLAVSVGNTPFEVGLLEGRLPGPGPQVTVYLIEHPLFGDRPGVYGPPNNPAQGYSDNALRFALLSKAAIALSRELGLFPDVIHAHDWQAGLAVHYAQQADWDTPPATVFTVHNLMFQGLFPLDEARNVGLEEELLTPDGIEFYGQASFIKAGLQLADRLTTVSPRYAQEICTAEFGYGLDGVMRARAGRLVGILNGVDYDRWSPWLDGALPVRYGKQPTELEAMTEQAFAAELVGKAQCKADLQRELSLPVRPRTPLFCTISRLTDQKGIDLLIDWLDGELSHRADLQFVLLGQGEPGFEQKLRMLSERFPTRLAVRLAFDEGLAHRIEAGSDFFVMPSRFEPCGLNQIYSMRYGTLPIVRATGGLFDTVVDFDARSRSGTGFVFQPFSVQALGNAAKRAMSAYHSDEQGFLAMQKRAMKADFGWAASARAYLHVYQQAQAGK
ncbi:MAG TPA: glycogen synthase GlgA [Pseudomonadota bacterium]|nr:glycogen synthase GlgA [Pseudomonadota bacterium]